MSHRTRAWQLIVGATLLLGCKQGETNAEDEVKGAKCGAQTKCPSGYTCDYGTSNPNNPQSIGKCAYVECGLTDLCKKQEGNGCLLDKATASCDRFNPDKFCGCVEPLSQEVPTTPTTGDGK